MDDFNYPLVVLGSIAFSIIMIVVGNYFDDRDPENLDRVKRRLSNGVCNHGPFGCKYRDTIEGKPGCRIPPFEECEYNVSPDEYFGDAKTIQEWQSVLSLNRKVD